MSDATTLPNLTGTNKQVHWAEGIRAAAMQGIEKFAAQCAALRAKIEAGELPAGTPAEKITKALAELDANDAAVAKLRNTAKASWWIDNRLASTNALVMAARA